MSTAALVPEPDAHPFRQSLRTYLRAGYPLLYVVSPEEDRAIELIAGRKFCEPLINGEALDGGGGGDGHGRALPGKGSALADVGS